MIAMRRIEEGSYGSSHEGASGADDLRRGVRAIRRAVLDGAARANAEAPPLERQQRNDRPPRVEAATPLEGTRIDVRRVPGEPVVGFAAFLDGVQRSVALAHRGTVPLVVGSVAAAVRMREERRMHTWNAVTHHALYLPVGALESAYVDAMRGQCTVMDTAADDTADSAHAGVRHPAEWTALAYTAVQRARERAEQALALAWVRAGAGPLLVDGGISGEAEVAQHALAVGVVKSHRTLYATDDSLERTLALQEGERTTAVVLQSPRRTPVASWYLRLRSSEGRDPFFGLVRVEIAMANGADLTARADLVSRWVLAERTPVALPDARWPVMVYGIRDCEEYLSAILR